jgi:hypothetical protein
MKMPGNNGSPITIHGSFLRSDNCDKEFQRLAEMFNRREFAALVDKVDYNQPPPEDTNGKKDEKFDAGKSTLAFQVHPEDPAKVVNVAKGMPEA